MGFAFRKQDCLNDSRPLNKPGLSGFLPRPSNRRGARPSRAPHLAPARQAEGPEGTSAAGETQPASARFPRSGGREEAGRGRKRAEQGYGLLSLPRRPPGSRELWRESQPTRLAALLRHISTAGCPTLGGGGRCVPSPARQLWVDAGSLAASCEQAAPKEPGVGAGRPRDLPGDQTATSSNH